MRRFARLLSSLAFIGACLTVLTAIALFAAEQSGFLRGEIESRLAAALGERGAQLEIEAARLRWFRPGIEIDGLQLGPADSGGYAPLAAEQIWIDLDVDFSLGLSGLSGRGVRIARAEVRGVYARLGHPFWSQGSSKPSAPTWVLDDQNWPTVSLRNVVLDWEDERLGRVPLGSFDAWLSPRGDRVRTLRGYWRPALLRTEQPLAWRAEIEPEGGPVHFRAALRDAELALDELPSGPLAVSLRQVAPNGSVSIDIDANLPRAASWDAMRPSGELHAELRSCSITHPTTGAELAIDQLSAEAELAPEGWGLSAEAAASFCAAPIELRAVAGPLRTGSASAGSLALRAQDLPLNDETLQASGLAGRLQRAWDGIRPHGVADVLVDVLLPNAPDANPEVLVEVVAQGLAGVEYHGLTNLVTGKRAGFPLPVEGVRGSTLVLHTPGREPRARTALLDLSAHHDYAPTEAPLEAPSERPLRARARGLIVVPALRGGLRVRPEVLLEVEVEDLIADAELRRALTGLRGTDWIWPMLDPRGGRGDGHLRLLLHEGLERPISQVTAAFEGTTLSWSRVPIPYRAERLELELLSDSGLAVHVDSRGALRTADGVELSADVWLEPGPAGRPPSETMTSRIDIELANMALRGEDIAVLDEALPRVGDTLRSASAAGKIDANLRIVQALPGDTVALGLEATPRQVECVPRLFPVPARGVEGRVLVDGRLATALGGSLDGSLPSQFVVRLAPIVADWSAGARIAIEGTIDADGATRQTVHAARVRTADRNLMAAIAASAARDDATPADFSVLKLQGRVDCSGLIEVSAATEDRQPRTSFRAQMRGNDLSFENGSGPSLQKLIGPVEIDPDGFFCSALDCVLGNTPIRLEDLLIESTEGGGYRIRTRVSAERLPLDEQHLDWMLDDLVLSALIEEFDWRGEVDLLHTELFIQGLPTGEFQVEFGGRLLFSDVFLVAGLPLHISSAFADVHSFVYENGSVRAWAELSDLFGRIANRPIDDASLVVSYLTPRFNVLELSGQFAGGRVRGLQTASALTGPVFSLDLEEPYRFELGLRLGDTEVGQLLEGLFESTIAPRGQLAAQVRLFGNFENLVDLRGSGEVLIAKARLWSLPVVRLILSTLGAENSAVFDQMFTRFKLEAGSIQMSDIRVSSPLLNLIGFGALDLDGSLSYELQVRYSLVDKLGPLTRLLYWVQNNLISVSVRGDMQRPQVTFRGLLGLFRRNRQPERGLPLPAYSPLPERF